jgi:hypothetical protein
VALLLAYGIGHWALIVAAGASAEEGQQDPDWNGSSRGAVWIRRISQTVRPHRPGAAGDSGQSQAQERPRRVDGIVCDSSS